ITMPQYLTNRFATANPALKVVCAVIFLISFTLYVASAFNAGTTVLCTVIPWFQNHQQLAMLVFAAIILVYTFMGGYKAVCWTDFFQGLLMLVAVLAVPIVMTQVGSFDAMYNGAFADGVTAFSTNPFTVPWQEIVTGLGWGLGYFGMPHILVRFMAIKKSSMIKKSATVAIVWVILTLGAAIAIAILGRTFVLGGTSVADTLLTAGKQEQIFIKIVEMIFPSFIVGLLLSAIIAAAMSTADSQLLVASSSFTSDIYQPIIRKNKAGDNEMLWVGRRVVVIVSVVAFFIARSGMQNPDSWASSIMSLVSNAWGLFGAAFGPVVILSLFWKRFNYAGAIAGILAGAAVDIAWLVFLSNTGIYEIVPGFIAGLVVSVIVTLITKKPSDDVIAIYEKATDKSIDD
ncbi:MAG: sodium/proline symporter, partial [Clostridia bacterium]|nr:sodium/proline symporter [Clostridia bacterium]